jgi:two-component system, sensor histidine kinase and response regulator
MPKILIVDDDAQLRSTIQMVLKLKGYEVLDADNGVTALKLARAALPDLIISDVNMPQADGYTALTELRKDPATASIPLILMTGNAEASGMRKGMDLGADDYLDKPFAMNALLKAVETRLKKVEVVKQTAEKKLAELRANLSLMLPHELNTPLVGILGYGEIISSCADTLQPAELAEMGKNILESGQRLQRLIQNFLIYSQLELLHADEREVAAMRAKRVEDVHEPLLLVARTKAQAAGRLNDLRADLCHGAVCCAEDLLSKIVEEILGNAFKFSKPGTPVKLAVLPEGKVLKLVIADQGRGMKPEYINSIAAYVQFDRRQHEQQGSGLGLVIAKRLIELHGGTLSLESTENVGTTATIRLPMPA